MKISAKITAVFITAFAGAILGVFSLAPTTYALTQSDCDNISAVQDEINVIQNDIEKTQVSMDSCSQISDAGQKLICITNYSNQINTFRKNLSEKKISITNLQSACSAVYGKVISSLSDEIKYLDSMITAQYLQIQVEQNDIDTLQAQINSTQKDINTALANISDTKGSIATSLIAIYEYNSLKVFNLTFGSASLSDIFNEVEYIQGLQNGLSVSLGKLKNQKTSLEQKQQELQDKQQKIIADQQAIQLDIADNEGLKAKRQNLVSITKGDQQVFQQLMNNINQQTQQLLSNLSDLAAQNTALIAQLKAQLGGDVSGWGAFGVPVFLQTDYKVNSNGSTIYLGPSLYTFSGNGCAVTSVAMVLAYYGRQVNPMTLNNDWETTFGCSGNSGGICWGGVAGVFNMIISGQPGHSLGTNVNIDDYYQAGRPMIVFLNTSRTGTKGHYVVITGKDPTAGEYLVNDPILGTTQLSVSKAFIERIYSTTVTIDQLIIYLPN